jgi:hypothetical protein
VLHGELQQLDQNLFKAVNGDEGGTWAPSSVITIGGAGLTLSLVGINTLSGALEVESESAVDVLNGSFLRVYGEATFRAGSFTAVRDGAFWQNQTGSNTTYDSGSTLIVNGFLTVGVGSTSTFQGGVVFDTGSVVAMNGHLGMGFFSSLQMNGLATFTKQVNMSAGASCAGPLLCGGAGRVVNRTNYIASTGASASFGPQSIDRVIVAALTADVIFTVDETGALDGDEMRFVNLSTTHNLLVLLPGGSPVGSVVLKNVSGLRRDCTVVRIAAGVWVTDVETFVP